MSVLQRDGMHAWGQIGNTAGKPFLVFTEKRVSFLQDGFVFEWNFLCRRNLPVDLVAHNAVISAAVRSLKPSGHPAVGAVQGRWVIMGSMWGQRTRCATSQAWCHGAQLFSNGREGCQKQLICHQFATKPLNTHCKNSNSWHASTLMKTWDCSWHLLCFMQLLSYSAFHCETIICPTLTIALNSWRETSPSNTMLQGVSQRCFKKRLWYL